MSNVNSDVAKRIVLSGLERRRADREKAAQEARLEKYEKDMIVSCNEHCADAKVQRQEEETERLSREQLEARRAAREAALAKEIARDQAASDAVKKYIVACMAAFCLTIFTYFPVWAAVTLALGLAVFPAACIFRLYFPAE